VPVQGRSWFSHLIAVVRTQNGELTEDVVHRDVVEDGAAETPHGPIVDTMPLADPSPDESESRRGGRA